MKQNKNWTIYSTLSILVAILVYNTVYNRKVNRGLLSNDIIWTVKDLLILREKLITFITNT